MFKRNTNADEVKDYEGTGGKFLNKSGMYEDVILKAVIFDEAENGGAVINFYVNYQGEDQVVYGDLRVYNKGGEKFPNAIGQRNLNELLVVLDIDGLDEPVEQELPIGKKKAMKTVAVYEEIEEMPVTIRILNEYSVWNNNIQEKTTTAKFYRSGDNATAAEILLDAEKPGEVELGSKYAKDLEFADSVKYKDDLTAEQITAWIKAKKPKGTAGATATAKPSFKKPKSKFGK